MPLVKECSRAAYEANLKELLRTGYPRDQAVAIAQGALRQACGGFQRATNVLHATAAKKPKPDPVPKEALAYLKAKKLKPGFSYLDVWKEEHAVAFTVAKVMERDILKDVQASLEKAVEEGRPFKQWAKEAKPLLDRSGWSAYEPKDRKNPYRLVTIYDTNMRTARAVGQWQRIQRTKRTHPFLQYNLGPSEVHREEHEAWEGLILPVDDPFWDEHMPPNGYRCKCWVRQLSRAEAIRLGGVSPSPEDEREEWTNPKTGETVEVPVGVTPGFDFNPGQSFKERVGAIEEDA